MLKPARVVNLSVEYPTIEASGAKPLVLATGDIRIVCSDKEAGPLKIALRALKEDFRRVMDTEALVSDTVDSDNAKPEIVIVNRGSGALPASSNKIRPLDGFESHRVYADRDANRIYLEGHDLRGTIYAIYTFSEQVLGVPPLHYWCSWVPKKKDRVEIPADFDLYFRSPQVRYRSILPGDQDFFMPWKKRSAEHQNVWLETTLRLKLNTVETYSTIKPGYRLTEYAYLIGKYGLVITAHHICSLNTSFSTWETFWQEVRRRDPPKLLLATEGVRLTRFLAPMPYCAPSRASLLTGRYPYRNGIVYNPTPDRGIDDYGLDPAEVTVAEVLRGIGYRTACVGKWHLGHKARWLPTRQGFDQYLGILYSNDMRKAPWRRCGRSRDPSRLRDSNGIGEGV